MSKKTEAKTEERASTATTDEVGAAEAKSSGRGDEPTAAPKKQKLELSSPNVAQLLLLAGTDVWELCVGDTGRPYLRRQAKEAR